MCGQVVCGQIVCVSKLCVSRLCVSTLCARKLCVSKLFVDKLCVRQAAGGRRRKQAGVHKQKQERHTKMWGKKHTHPLLQPSRSLVHRRLSHVGVLWQGCVLLLHLHGHNSSSLQRCPVKKQTNNIQTNNIQITVYTENTTEGKKEKKYGLLCHQTCPQRAKPLYNTLKHWEKKD